MRPGNGAELYHLLKISSLLRKTTEKRSCRSTKKKVRIFKP
jgi:hypothetical protein